MWFLFVSKICRVIRDAWPGFSEIFLSLLLTQIDELTGLLVMNESAAREFHCEQKFEATLRLNPGRCISCTEMLMLSSDLRCEIISFRTRQP